MKDADVRSSSTTMDHHVLVWILLLLPVMRSATQGSKPEYTEILSNFTCVLTYQSWVLPDRLLITWEQLPVLSNGTEVTVRWYSDIDTGVCSKTTLTSCMCRYGDADAMNFDTFFKLHVSTKDQTFILPIDPVKCQKPLQVSEVIAEAPNSTCIDVTWSYSRREPVLCSNYGERVFQISYTPRTTQNPVEETLPPVQSCSGRKLICGLVPYTLYDVSVRCKVTDENGHSVGHWSQPRTTTATTLQSIPTGAPQLVEGGYRYISSSCHRNERVVRLYFQPVPLLERNGIITTYHVSILEIQDSISHTRVRKFEIPGTHFYMNLELKCRSGYQINMTAATEVGVANTVSNTVIPASDGMALKGVTIVPMVTENDTLTVSWKLDSTLTSYVSDIIIFWCLKSITGECQENPSWQSSYIHSTSTTIRPLNNQPLHRYMVGVSAGSHGITWTTCHFDTNPIPRRPIGVTLGPLIADRSLTVTWENSPCESRTFGPYIDHFRIQICPVLHIEYPNCSDSVTLHGVGHDEASYVIRDLDPDVTYMIWITAIGIDNSESSPSVKVYGKPLSSGNGISVLSWLLPVTLAVLVIAILAGVLFLRRKIKRRYKEKIEIRMPDIPLLDLPIDMEAKVEDPQARRYASC